MVIVSFDSTAVLSLYHNQETPIGVQFLYLSVIKNIKTFTYRGSKELWTENSLLIFYLMEHPIHLADI